MHKWLSRSNLNVSAKATFDSMQRLWLILNVALLAHAGAFAQKVTSRISSLKTDEDVKSLVHPLGWEYEELILGDSACLVYKPYAHTALRCTGQSWYRADFDSNGWPDLLVVGRRRDIPFVFCVLDSGNNRFQVVRDFYNSLDERQPTARVAFRQGQALLRYTAYARRRSGRGKLQNRRTQLLACRGGGFVPYEKQPTNHHITAISYQSRFNYHGQFATTVNINATGLATLKYQATVQGDSVASLKHAQYQLSRDQLYSLFGLLNYIHFATCRPVYGTGMENHRPRVDLQIGYEGGTKVIHDTKGGGTLGLAQVYENLERLTTQLRLH